MEEYMFLKKTQTNQELKAKNNHAENHHSDTEWNVQVKREVSELKEHLCTVLGEN